MDVVTAKEEPQFESLVRRSRSKGRSCVLTLKLTPDSMELIDGYASKKSWTRADAGRALLRAGLIAEGVIK